MDNAKLLKVIAFISEVAIVLTAICIVSNALFNIPVLLYLPQVILYVATLITLILISTMKDTSKYERISYTAVLIVSLLAAITIPLVVLFKIL